MLFNQPLDHFGAPGNFVDIAHDLEQLDEVLQRRVLHLNLVRNPSQERVVDQILWLEVGRKHNQLIEGHLDLLTITGVEKVVTFFQRNNPTVQ